MFDGPLLRALAQPPLAGLLAAGLGLAAVFAGRWVAAWTHRTGLRAAPPGPLSASLVPGLGYGLLAWAVAASGATIELRALVFGLLAGHATMDLAHNVRAAASLRAVTGDEVTLAAWRAVPPATRGALAAAHGAAVGVTLAVLALLVGEPFPLGFALGAGLQQATFRRAIDRLTAQPND